MKKSISLFLSLLLVLVPFLTNADDAFDAGAVIERTQAALDAYMEGFSISEEDGTFVVSYSDIAIGGIMFVNSSADGNVSLEGDINSVMLLTMFDNEESILTFYTYSFMTVAAALMKGAEENTDTAENLGVISTALASAVQADDGSAAFSADAWEHGLSLSADDTGYYYTFIIRAAA